MRSFDDDKRDKRRRSIIKHIADALELEYSEAETYIESSVSDEFEEAIDAGPGSGAIRRLKKALGLYD